MIKKSPETGLFLHIDKTLEVSDGLGILESLAGLCTGLLNFLDITAEVTALLCIFLYSVKKLAESVFVSVGKNIVLVLLEEADELESLCEYLRILLCILLGHCLCEFLGKVANLVNRCF